MTTTTLAIVLATLAILLCITIYAWALIQFKRVSVSLAQFVKAMDVLYSNQEKILELTKIKSFVQLVNEEDRTIKKELVQEKIHLGNKDVKGTV